jgi:hypothetical protein
MNRENFRRPRQHAGDLVPLAAGRVAAAGPLLTLAAIGMARLLHTSTLLL